MISICLIAIVVCSKNNPGLWSDLRSAGLHPGYFLNSLSVWFCSPCVEKDEQGPISEAWDVDPVLITKLKEQYKKERKGKKGVKSKSYEALEPPSSSSLCRAWLSWVQPLKKQPQLKEKVFLVFHLLLYLLFTPSSCQCSVLLSLISYHACSHLSSVFPINLHACFHHLLQMFLFRDYVES